MSDTAWIAPLLTGARPRAIAALLRYFRDLDIVEEAYQEASLRALQRWPTEGAPREPLAWLVFVGRNAALDHLRQRRHHDALPDDEAAISDLEDAESRLVEALDRMPYRDDLLRLLFVCCHPELPATQQVALALRVVSGLSVKEIARAFLVSESAMEQRITRAKRRVAATGVPFDTPGAADRAARLAAVMTTVYLLFNEGYSASGGDEQVRGALCDEALRLGRLLRGLFPDDPELLGLLALMLLQHARSPARLGDDGAVVLLGAQDRGRWNREAIAEGLALVDEALRQRRPGPYQLQAAIAATHARAAQASATDWAEIDRLYAALEVLQPSPVVTLNRAVAVSNVQGAEAALAMLDALAGPLAGYFHFHGTRGTLLQQLGRRDEARAAYTEAIALAHTAHEAAHIRNHLDRLASGA